MARDEGSQVEKRRATLRAGGQGGAPGVRGGEVLEGGGGTRQTFGWSALTCRDRLVGSPEGTVDSGSTTAG